MKKAFAITAVVCAGCGVQTVFQPPALVPDETVMEAAGTNILAAGHVKEKSICTTPKMTIFYINALVPDETFDPIESKTEKSKIVH